MTHVAVIGSGPAGLIAADVLSEAGLSVTIYEAKPSAGRKFLMAGKSGLNLTKDEDPDVFGKCFSEASDVLRPILKGFGPQEVQAWAGTLRQKIFTGSTGRVFPKAMKASPLMRAWLARLATQGVTLRTRMRWQGWNGDQLVFETLSGQELVAVDAVVLALGGASWARLGSDGAWAELLRAEGVDVAPFKPANFGVQVQWSARMQRHFGAALKGVQISTGAFISRGEAVISARGLEGGGIYEVSRGLRDGAALHIDLLPKMATKDVAERLSRPRGKASFSNHLRKSLRLDPAKIALAQECAHPLPKDPAELAACLKSLRVPYTGPRPMDEAISTAGGVAFTALTNDLMLRAKPGVFCAGEMLDWEAPTGGYLITACLATGRWAALGVLRRLNGS